MSSASSARKYANSPTYVDGILFDSLAESNRYRELLLLRRAGEISELVLQPKFWLKCGGKDVLIRSEGYPNGRRASYRADFQYLDHATSTTIVEDVKGMDTSESRLRRAMVEAEYGVRVVVISSRKRSKRFRKRR